ncbi:Uncharacterized protein BM_BM1128 [Brugia malayi]|uniref:Bm1128 n=1 Tax=Brugia malayi TaxID=6279 RepID=A0A0K0IR77_BRUMA|nr:Uncharacterized protein BM_BM1128 [Brugia malayi]CDP91396.1 Bm1128 [Brugia malayi]VIO87305.1 Uncharacterized protein BM_BM1128 [Brugia malayi]
MRCKAGNKHSAQKQKQRKHIYAVDLMEMRASKNENKA